MDDRIIDHLKDTENRGFSINNIHRDGSESLAVGYGYDLLAHSISEINTAFAQNGITALSPAQVTILTGLGSSPTAAQLQTAQTQLSGFTITEAEASAFLMYTFVNETLPRVENRIGNGFYTVEMQCRNGLRAF